MYIFKLLSKYFLLILKDWNVVYLMCYSFILWWSLAILHFRPSWRSTNIEFSNSRKMNRSGIKGIERMFRLNCWWILRIQDDITLNILFTAKQTRVYLKYHTIPFFRQQGQVVKCTSYGRQNEAVRQISILVHLKFI